MAYRSWGGESASDRKKARIRAMLEARRQAAMRHLFNLRQFGTQNPNVPGSMAHDLTWAGGTRGAGLGASTTQGKKPVLVETDNHLDDLLRASDREYVQQIPTPPFSSPPFPEGALASDYVAPTIGALEEQSVSPNLPGSADILGDAGVPQVGGMSVAQSLASLARVDPKLARDLMSNRSFRRGIDHTSYAAPIGADATNVDHGVTNVIGADATDPTYGVNMHRFPLASSRAGPTRQHFPGPLAASYPYGQTDDYGMIINPAFASPLSPEGALASNYVAPNVIGADATNVDHGVTNVIGADAADPTYGVAMHRRPLPNSIRGAGMISPRQFTGVDLTTQETEGLPENWRSVTGFDDQGNPIVNDMISRVDTDFRTRIPRPSVEEEAVVAAEAPVEEDQRRSGDHRDWGPGLNRERAEELHGPGGMYYEDAGQLDRALGISPNALDRTQAAVDRPQRQRDRYDPAPALKKIDQRRRMLKGLAAAFGVRDRSADYEARALQRYGEYMTNRSLAGLTDEDFESKRSLFFALRDGGAPLSTIRDVFNLDITAPKGGSKLSKAIREGLDWVTYELHPDGTRTVFARSPISAGVAKTTVQMQSQKGQTKAQEAFGTTYGGDLADLLSDQDKVFSGLNADNMMIEPLIEALESGEVDTGFGAGVFTSVKGMLANLLPESTTQELYQKDAGMAEWWSAAAQGFLKAKLAMTKGAVSDKEMAIFMKMIPRLENTEYGNIRLLRMLRSINNMELGMQLGAQDYVKDLAGKGLDVGGTGNTAKEMVELKKFQARRTEIARKEFKRAQDGLPDSREEAFEILREDSQYKDKSDEAINNYLDRYF